MCDQRAVCIHPLVKTVHSVILMISRCLEEHRTGRCLNGRTAARGDLMNLFVALDISVPDVRGASPLFLLYSGWKSERPQGLCRRCHLGFLEILIRDRLSSLCLALHQRTACERGGAGTRRVRAALMFIFPAFPQTNLTYNGRRLAAQTGRPHHRSTFHRVCLTSGQAGKRIGAIWRGRQIDSNTCLL